VYASPPGEASSPTGAKAVITNLLNGQYLAWDASTATWRNASPAAAGVSSLNGLTGALSIGAGAGIGVSAAGSTVTVSNTGVTQIVAGTNVTISPAGGTGVVTINASGGGAVSSVSNSDGTLTISPTTGSVVASLNLGNANVWTAAQTFPASGIRLLGSSTGYTTLASANAGASNYTAIIPAASGTLLYTTGELDGCTLDGVAFSFTSLATSNFLQYNGTNWVGANTKCVLGGFQSGTTVSTTPQYAPLYLNLQQSSGGLGAPIPYAGTARNLYLHINTNGLSSADSITVTLYNGTSATAVTITFAGGVTGLQSDTTHSAVFAAGNIPSLAFASSASSGSFTFGFGFEFDQT
jgi:hypothetical protein